jgi:hypothetical protein
MEFSKEDIQKAFNTAKNSGLGDFMFQEPFSNQPLTGKNRRVSNNQRQSRGNQNISNNQKRCNCKNENTSKIKPLTGRKRCKNNKLRTSG